LQPKLLRAVQEQEFERLGSAKTIQVDVRIIAATHRDLATLIREGTFREDLFYRWNVFPIEIPPLRERRDNIPLLVNYFVSKLSRRMGKKIKSVPRQAMQVLANACSRVGVRKVPRRMKLRDLKSLVLKPLNRTGGQLLHEEMISFKPQGRSPAITTVAVLGVLRYPVTLFFSVVKMTTS